MCATSSDHPARPARLYLQHGTYRGNLGDAAMLRNLYDLIREAAPNARVMVRDCAADLEHLCPGCDRVTSLSEYLVYSPWLWIGSKFGLSTRPHSPLYCMVFSVRLLMALAIARVSRCFRRILTRDDSLKRFVQAMGSTDGMIVGGAGGFKDTNPQWCHTVCGEIIVASALGCRVTMSGQGIGPVRSRFTRLLMRLALPRCRSIALRDAGASEELLVRFGIPARLLRTVGDDATGLAAYPANWARDRLADQGFNGEGIRYVAVHYRLNVLNPGYEEYVDLLEGVVDRLIAIPNVRVLFFVTDEDAGERDLGCRILGRWPSEGKAAVLPPFHDPSELKSLLGICSCAIGASYHFITFALSQGVPALGLYREQYFQGKITGVMTLFGHRDWAVCLDEADAEHVSQRAEDLLNAPETVREELRIRGCRLARCTQESMRRAIREAMGSGGADRNGGRATC